VPPFFQLQAPAQWRTVDFISDLHLQASEAETFEAWRRYMAETPADAVFILGDLFEVWVGDDAAAAPGFAADCATVLRATAARVALFFMRGNRDFLVLGFGGRRWLLTHGDALCLADTEYMRFRSQVRTPEWQREFLSRPLAERQAIAADLRERSTARKNSGVEYADVDSDAARAWLNAADAQVLIHGHTHRPGDHDLRPLGQRVVLSDWDARSHPPRQQVLRLTGMGLRRIAFT
jgi:UDP-2,3-diacylglucosamine hydrolase